VFAHLGIWGLRHRPTSRALRAARGYDSEGIGVVGTGVVGTGVVGTAVVGTGVVGTAVVGDTVVGTVVVGAAVVGAAFVGDGLVAVCVGFALVLPGFGGDFAELRRAAGATGAVAVAAATHDTV
jgi:hypothetical protein